MNGQQTKTRQAGDAAFDAVGVFYRLTQHLVAAADAHHHLSVAMGPLDGLCATVTTQFHEVVERGLGAWQDDDIGLLDVGGVVGVEQVHAWVALQRIKVSIVADMP